ncbi:MAG: hypothetical protein K2Q01_08255 [Rickettsiales bacterium]|nr:hypothetical protein [Rickettsiales bacterium]
MSTQPERPSNEDIRQFTSLLGLSLSDRIPEDRAFVETFARRWFHAEDGRRLTPKRIMAATPELWEAYQMWNRDQKLNAPLGEIPIEVRRRVQDESPKKTAAPAEPPEGEEASRVPKTRVGDLLHTLDVAGKLSDEQAARIAERDNGRGVVRRVKQAAAVGLVGLAGLAGYGGIRMALEAKKAGEKVGGEVEQIQKDVGKFADDPQGTIPRTQDARDREEKRRQEEKQNKQKGLRK